jgi:hypothetical protein
MAKKKEAESYRLTPKGLLHVLLNDEESLKMVMDGLELYMRRHYNDGGECGAIIFDGKNFIFSAVGKKEGE